MKKTTIGVAVTMFLLGSATAAVGDDRPRRDDDRQEVRFNDHDQQVVHDWYQQNHDRAPRGFRDRDRLSAEDEARLQEGYVFDRNFRRHAYSAPYQLTRLLPPAPHRYHYVTVGGHVVLVDREYRVRSVMHVHEEHHN